MATAPASRASARARRADVPGALG